MARNMTKTKKNKKKTSAPSYKVGRKLWSGRFARNTDKLAEEFNASIGFDRRLFSHDIRGSIAHAQVLEKAGVLKKTEARKIVRGLRVVEKEIEAGKVKLTSRMEDIHMAIEERLTKKIGPVGGKLHTGRSRNDQVATDLRLYLKDEIEIISALTRDLQRVIVGVAEENLGVIMPGYTHMQRAQAVLFSHHLLAYYEMLERDRDRLAGAYMRADILPLGSGALAGSPYKLNRSYAAKLLGFSKVSENSLDGVASRYFVLEFLSASAIMAVNLSRLAEELILWSSEEFGFVEMSDAFSTGSSIMPQKKNPDMAELVRGKTGRVSGNLVALLTTMKALPLAYNKDMQEDKEPLFDTVDTMKSCLSVMAPMLATMKVKAEAMEATFAEGFLTATDGADYLVKKGMPFRQSHSVMGRVVAYCIKKDKGLEDLTFVEWQRFSKLFEKDIRRVVKVPASVNSRSLRGGTALGTVTKRLLEVEKELKR